ncbi:MAG: fused MFS/spermidine synthase [Acidobacteria bacterium]|nr:fused MFS/spermidine synthase [Acidobacteriota bacterium]
MFLYAVAVFLSAFLLFQIQPIIARIILSWFGGTAAVWTTCMLFFQIGLLAGYFYSHSLIKRLSPRAQSLLHIVLLVLSLAALPILPGEGWKPEGTENPTIRILLLLAATVGLPYMLLSTTSPLLQAWYARSKKGALPYRLFALSNLGSMLALLSYPPLIEPNMPTRMQAYAWSGGYVLFAALTCYLAYKGRGAESLAPVEATGEAIAAEGEAAEVEAPPALGRKILWVALAACPSMLMLAVTNHMSQDVAAIPFLWVLPLSLYLLSFILTFDARGWYQRNIFLVMLAPGLGGMAYLQWSNASELKMQWTIAALAAGFFICCMVCHGELAARKPSPRYLTSFYLALSVGGAIGGLFVGVVAPYLFQNYFELPIALAFCGLLAYIVAIEEPGFTWRQAAATMPAFSLLAGMVGLWIFLGRSVHDSLEGYKLVTRNFYGTLRVRQSGDGSNWEDYKTLLHGSINHGEQWTHPARRRELLTYYCADTGIGRAMRVRTEGVPQKVGVLGLGAGTMAAFGRKGDDVTFYEINPVVPKLAHEEFSFYPDSPATKRIIMGDGRLSLERQAPQNFDVLMMDAFSGDSIPVHLVTKEAFQLYFRHLKPTGYLVMHISNKYLDLEPVLARIAGELNKSSMLVETNEDESGDCFGTTFIVMAHTPEAFQTQPFANAGTQPKLKTGIGMWTDDYSNLFGILK